MDISLIRKKTVSSNDQYFGESIKIRFFIDGFVDKERHERVIRGVLTTKEERIKKPDGGSAGSWHVPFAASTSRLAIDRNKYPDIVLRHGDKIQALSRSGKPWFKVISITNRSRRRLYVELGEA